MVKTSLHIILKLSHGESLMWPKFPSIHTLLYLPPTSIVLSSRHFQIQSVWCWGDQEPGAASLCAAVIHAANPELCPIPIIGAKQKVVKAIATIQIGGFFKDSHFLMLDSTCINFLQDVFAGNQNVLCSLELQHWQEVMIKALYNPKE